MPITRRRVLSGILRYNTFTHVDSRAQCAYGAQSFYWQS